MAQPALALFHGDSRTPLAHVVPDDEWPGMFRIVWPDGSRSDIVNLSRAKDAAAVVAGRSMPGHRPALFKWSREALGRSLVCLKPFDHAEMPTGRIERLQRATGRPRDGLNQEQQPND